MSGTEDDTFKKLRRRPYAEMKKLFEAWQRNIDWDVYTTCQAEGMYDDFFAEHGWTWDDFHDSIL